MAVTYGFFNSVNKDRKYNADQVGEFLGGLVSNGVFENYGGALQIKASAGMAVQMDAGKAQIDCKWFKNDAIITIALTPSHVTYSRYTAIIVRLDYTNRKMEVVAKDGVPATTPVRPGMTNTQTVKELCIAYVYVGRGVTSITQQNINDCRADKTVCGWVTGLIDQVDVTDLFLQYTAAYEENLKNMRLWQQEQQAIMTDWEVRQKQQFDEWYQTLTEKLQINTYIEKYQNTVTTTANTSVIYIGISQFVKETDVLFVHVNGMVLEDTREYVVGRDITGNKITLKSAIEKDNDVTFIVLKDKIGSK